MNRETIAVRCKRRLHPELAKALDTRTQLGIEKYGQRLDENDKPLRAKVIHLMQELLDAQQYAEWAGRDTDALELANIANDLQCEFDLAADEIVAGGKQ